jgi:small conductance mechanosensitive channel
MKLQAILQDWRGDWYNFFRHAVPKIIVVLVGAIILIWLLKLVTGRLVRFAGRKDLPVPIDPYHAHQLRTLAGVIYSVGIAVVAFFAAMQILPLLGIDMKPLLASAGIAGLAIGFGAQALVHDVINGFFILIEEQYHLGDVVRISGVAGTVEEMTLRRTVLRGDDGALHSIPNSQITIVSNLTRDWAQVQMHVAAAYGENSDRIIQLLQDIASELRKDPAFAEAVVADPQVPGIERISAGEVDYLLLVKTKPGSQYAVSRELRRRIKQRFEESHVQAAPARMFVVDSEMTGQKREIK